MTLSSEKSAHFDTAKADDLSPRSFVRSLRPRYNHRGSHHVTHHQGQTPHHAPQSLIPADQPRWIIVLCRSHCGSIAREGGRNARISNDCLLCLDAGQRPVVGQASRSCGGSKGRAVRHAGGGAECNPTLEGREQSARSRGGDGPGRHLPLERTVCADCRPRHTNFAPKPSAFSTSVPRRMPLSIMTVMPPASAAIAGSTRSGAIEPSSWRAP